MTPKPTKAKARRTHTLGGCGHCRRRHVKCDQTRPACSACNKARLSCDGYSSGMRWVDTESQNATTSDNAANTKVRRQLYSGSSISTVTKHVPATDQSSQNPLVG